MAREELTVRMRLLNALQFKRGLDAATASTRRLGASAKMSSRSMMVLEGATKRTNRAMMAAGRAARHYAVWGLVAGAYEAKRMIAASSDLREEMNKSRVVFRGGSADIMRWSRNSATALLMSRTEAIQTANTFGAMLVPMGFARNESLRMSKTMVQLVADMASLHNVEPGEMAEKMRSGLAGMSRPLRAYGIDLRAAAAEEFAHAQGVKQSWQEMSGRQKTMILYRKILADAAKQGARGDVKRTLHSTANQQRVLRANVKDLEQAIGDKLNPTWNRLLNTVNRWLSKGDRSKQIAKRVSDGMDDIARTGKIAYNVLKPFAGMLWHMRKPLAAVAGLWVGLSVAMGAIRKVGGLAKMLGIGAVAKRLGFGGDRGSKFNPMYVVVMNGPVRGAPGRIANAASRLAPLAPYVAAAAPYAAGLTVAAGVAWGISNYHGPRFRPGPGGNMSRRRAAQLAGGTGPGGIGPADPHRTANLLHHAKLHRANGGVVPGFGYSDSVQAALTPGEYVVRREAVRAHGVSALDRLNAGASPDRDIVIVFKPTLDGRVIAESVHRHSTKAKALR